MGETGDEPLPTYSEEDFTGTAWNGISEEFYDASQPDDYFPIVLVWVDEPNWTLNFSISGLIAGGSGSTTLSPSLGQVPVIVTGGSIILEDWHGFFTGTLTSDVGDWQVRGLLTPDKEYFAGFAYRDPWTGYWHDLSLEKQ